MLPFARTAMTCPVRLVEKVVFDAVAPEPFKAFAEFALNSELTPFVERSPARPVIPELAEKVRWLSTLPLCAALV